MKLKKNKKTSCPDVTVLSRVGTEHEGYSLGSGYGWGYLRTDVPRW